jgi:hypothetical protein
MGYGKSEDQKKFEATIRALHTELTNAGVHLTLDSAARLRYTQQIQAMSSELSREVAMGRLTWAQAAEQAQTTRNLIMEIIRKESTPVGRAIAESLKKEGKTLDELLARKSSQLFGTSFDRLDEAQKNKVFAEIVKSAGKSRPEVTAKMAKLSRAGRGLIVLSIALSVYNVAVADDKADAAKKEVAVTVSGIGGGIAGGAVAGLVCGPGAPVCVTVGVFVGGALAAFGVDFFW